MNSPVTAAPPTRSNLSGLLLGIAAAMCCVARPLANQFAPYSPLSAFSGFFTLLFIFCAAAVGWRQSRLALPRGLAWFVFAWLALFIVGAWRSPYMGAAVPLCTDATLYILMLAAGCIAAHVEPALAGIVIRSTIALAVIEAFAAIWQVHVDLPRLRAQIESGALPLIDSLKGKIGLDRLYGDNAFGTFGNPNSLAGFLLLGFFLLLGHAAAARKYFSPLVLLAGALMLWALYWTGSKGGIVALLCGGWFFALQRLNVKRRRPLLNWLTVLGIAALPVLLLLGFYEIIPSRHFGLSMQVRFEYWRAALSMFKRHPFAGVGLGGYGEWYSIFKTPLGWESKDPHNEFVCLAAELGIFAPLLYGALWWWLLKPRAQAAVDSKVRSEFFSDRRGELCVSACGSLCLLLALLNFDVLNSGDFFSVISGNDTSRGALLNAAQTLSLPLIFSAVMYFLSRSPSRPASPALKPSMIGSCALEQGFRAAAGACLLHQLVDFDFKAQAIMCPLMLLGGFFLSRKMTQPAANSPRSKYFSAALACAALLLVPTAVYIPLKSGLAREAAEAAESRLKVLTTNPEEIQDGESPERLRVEIVDAQLRARHAAPFDAEAHIDYALARMKYGARVNGSGDEILALFKETESWRPLAANPKVLIGSLYLRREIVAEKAGDTYAFNRAQAGAREAYNAAVECYPLNPGLRLMAGDPLTIAGRWDDEGHYRRAFDIDMRISDPNVYIAAIFGDPRPGVFARHGADHDVLDAIDKQFSETSAGNADATSRPGMLLRKLVAQAAVFSRHKMQADLEEAKWEALEKTSAELVAAFKPLPQRAHAAFLYALCVREGESFATQPEKQAAWKTKFDTALQAARELQAESVKSGNPGTAPAIFETLARPAESAWRK